MTLQQLLGTELPIIQAPMAGVQGAALAVAAHVTALNNLFAGRPARGIVNRVMRELARGLLAIP